MKATLRVGDGVLWAFGLSYRESTVASIRKIRGDKLEWKVGFWPHSAWSGEWVPTEHIFSINPPRLKEVEIELT